MKNRLFLIIATFGVLGSTITSCSWDDELRVATNDGDPKTPISFNVNVGSLPDPVVTTRSNNTLGGNVSSTRGYTTGSGNSGYTFSGGEYMTVAVTGKGVTSRPTSEVMKQYTVAAGSSGSNSLTYQKDANGTSATSGFDWLSTSETVSIRAWSDGKTTTPATPAVDPDNNTFTIETTQSGDVKELLYSPDTNYDYATYSSTLNIKLYHQLARIVVTATCDDTDFAVTAVNIGDDTDGHRIPITGKFSKPSTGNNYGSWSVESETAEPTHWKAIAAKQETSTTTNVYKYSAVVMPATYAKDFELLYLTADSKTYVYKLPAAVTLSPGKQYNFNILVKNSYITVTTDITDWTDVPSSDSFTYGDGLAATKTVKMNPLWYVANYNLDNTGAFDMTASTSQGYLFQWGTAMGLGFVAAPAGYDGYSLPTPQKTVSNGGATIYWHIPTLMEMYSIFPAYSIFSNYGDATLPSEIPEGSDGTELYDEPGCTFGYNNFTKYSNGRDNTNNTGVSYQSYWSTYTNNTWVRYAIRFLGTEFCSVWRYKFEDQNQASARLIVSSRLIDIIGPSDASSLTATMTSITSKAESYWENDLDNMAVQRTFYFCGYYSGNSVAAPGSDQKNRGFYWTATTREDMAGHSYCTHLRFVTGGRNHLGVFSHPQELGMSVRLFRDN